MNQQPSPPPPLRDNGVTASPAAPESAKSNTDLISRDWQQASQPVFVVEDSFYRSRTPPRPVHWSIAWSDLMMTMFILFLVLFAHLRSHHEILAHGTPNKVADETMPVHVEGSNNTMIFHPISQDVSMKIADDAQEIVPPSREVTGADVLIRHQIAEDRAKEESITPIPELPRAIRQEPPPPASNNQPAELPQPEAAAMEKQQEELITKIYDLSKITVEQEKLQRFASVEMIPDKTMRIILTGDLLFASGQAELSGNATDSLKKLANIIKKTPYMINVIGHTDDKPVKNARFPSNWELSLARAGRVARFLIDTTGLPPTQFRVTGYSYFRPLRPNTSDDNRKINRRVEIVLSKELPQVEAIPPANLQ